ncbi:MAG: hypothetical protein AAFP26_11525, partial [Planctomycetota bacterium]
MTSAVSPVASATAQEGDPWLLVSRLPESVRFAVGVEDGAALHRSDSGRALVRVLDDAGLLGATMDAWGGLASALGLDPLDAYEQLLGSRAVLGLGEAVDREGFDDPGQRWLVLSRVSEATEGLFRRRLDAQPRERLAGLPVLAIEDGRYRLAVVRDGRARPLLLLAPSGAQDLFVGALLKAMGDAALEAAEVEGIGGVRRSIGDTPTWRSTRRLRLGNGKGDGADSASIAVLHRSGDGSGWLAIEGVPTRTGWAIEGLMPLAVDGAAFDPAVLEDSGFVDDRSVVLRLLSASGIRLPVMLETSLGLEPGGLLSGLLPDVGLGARSPSELSPASVLTLERVGGRALGAILGMRGVDDQEFDAARLAVRKAMNSVGVAFDSVEEAAADLPGVVRLQPL